MFLFFMSLKFFSYSVVAHSSTFGSFISPFFFVTVENFWEFIWKLCHAAGEQLNFMFIFFWKSRENFKTEGNFAWKLKAFQRFRKRWIFHKLSKAFGRNFIHNMKLWLASIETNPNTVLENNLENFFCTSFELFKIFSRSFLYFLIQWT